MKGKKLKYTKPTLNDFNKADKKWAVGIENCTPGDSALGPTCTGNGGRATQNCDTGGEWA